MSFSFHVKAANKAELLDKIAAEMTRVVEQQPIHAKDEESVKATAAIYLDLIPDSKADHDLYANINGSLSWTGTDETMVFGAGVGVSVGWIGRPKA